MPSPPTLREGGLPAEVSEIPAKTSMEGSLDLTARRLDDGLCCLTEDAAVQLHRRRYSFLVGVTIVEQWQASDCNPI